jgi:hypothetical protein
VRSPGLGSTSDPHSVCHLHGVVWNSPLGRIYHTRRQPITTGLPDPRPVPEYPDYPPPATLDEDGLSLYRPPPEPGLPPR